MLAYIARHNVLTLNTLLHINPIVHWNGSIHSRTLNTLVTVTKVIDNDLLVFLLSRGCLVNIKPLLSINCSYPLIIKHELHKRNITAEEINVAAQCDVDTIKTVFTRLGSARGEIIRKCMEYNRIDAIDYIPITQRMLYSNIHMVEDIGKDIIPLLPEYKWFMLCKHATDNNRYKLVASLLHLLSKKSITKLFQYACIRGSTLIVKLLIPHAHITANNNLGLSNIIQNAGEDCGLLDNYNVQLCSNNIHILELLSHKPVPCLSKLAKYCDYTDMISKFIQRDNIYLVYLALSNRVYDVTQLTYEAFISASAECFTLLIKHDKCDLRKLVDMISRVYSLYENDARYYNIIRVLVSTRGIVLPEDIKISITKYYSELKYLL